MYGSIESEIRISTLVVMCLENQRRWRRLQTINIDLEVPLEKTEYKIHAGYINLQQLLQGHTLKLQNSYERNLQYV